MASNEMDFEDQIHQMRLEKYKLQQFTNIKNQWTLSRSQNLTNSDFDELVANTKTEVNNVMVYALGGKFARDYLELEKAIIKLYDSMKAAIKDPAINCLQNEDWAKQIVNLFNGKYVEFTSFIIEHQQDLFAIAEHISIITKNICIVLQRVISLTFGKIKELFLTALDYVKSCVLPTVFVAYFAKEAFISMFNISNIDLPQLAVICGTVVLTSIPVYLATKKYYEDNNNARSVKGIGLRSTKKCFKELVKVIEMIVEVDNEKRLRYETEIHRLIQSFINENDVGIQQQLNQLMGEKLEWEEVIKNRSKLRNEVKDIIIDNKTKISNLLKELKY